MIVKLREPMEFRQYESKQSRVHAIQMNEDFLYETGRGWQKGWKGQWLVESGECLRCAIDDESFKRQYVPLEE